MKKFIVAIMLLALAGVATFYLKDYIDSENPEYAIPQIEVTADTEVVAHMVTGYEWEFYNGRTASMSSMSWYDYEVESLTSTKVLGGERLNIEFTMPARAVMINRTNDTDKGFIPADNETTVPFEKGIYLYEVWAKFDKGWVMYYFKLLIE